MHDAGSPIADPDVSGPGEFELFSGRRGPVHHLGPCGELDLATAGILEEELLRVEQTDIDTIEIDLGGLTFIDCAGIHALTRAHARSRLPGSRRLQLKRGRPQVQRVFTLLGIEQILPFASATIHALPVRQARFVTDWSA